MDRDTVSPIGPAQPDTELPALELPSYAPHHLGVVNNAWLRLMSPIYRERFGISIVDWRVLAVLRLDGEATANRVCDVLRIDKAAASRALSELDRLGLVLFETPGRDPRKRLWRLSPSGDAMHDRALATALEFQAALLAGITPDDLGTFFRVIKRMRANLDRTAEQTTQGNVYIDD